VHAAKDDAKECQNVIVADVDGKDVVYYLAKMPRAKIRPRLQGRKERGRHRNAQREGRQNLDHRNKARPAQD
jgi:hypothetical protein